MISACLVVPEHAWTHDRARVFRDAAQLSPFTSPRACPLALPSNVSPQLLESGVGIPQSGVGCASRGCIEQDLVFWGRGGTLRYQIDDAAHRAGAI